MNTFEISMNFIESTQSDNFIFHGMGNKISESSNFHWGQSFFFFACYELPLTSLFSCQFFGTPKSYSKTMVLHIQFNV